jgi:hypothetical protein
VDGALPKKNCRPPDQGEFGGQRLSSAPGPKTRRVSFF